jgi:hypothetical protein
MRRTGAFLKRQRGVSPYGQENSEQKVIPNKARNFLVIMNRQKIFDYLILIIIFVLSRFMFLFFTPYTYYSEEAKIGSIGHDIVFEKNLRLPFWGYLDSPHAGGSLFSGLIAIPFYYIFGDKYLALKITALIFSLFTLALWYKLFLYETKERRAFILLLLLIIFSFATPHYVQKSVILAGNTVELMFFNTLIIFYFWKIKNNPAASSFNYFLLGILSGFSFWVQFMSFYLFLTIILTLLITERFRNTINHYINLIIGFLLGVLPLWVYNFLYKWATFTADPRAKIYFSFNPRKLIDLLFVDLPASFHFLDIGGIKSQYLSFVVYGVFILGILMHLRNNLSDFLRKKNKSNSQKIRMNLEIFLILYMVIFILISAFTPFPIRSNEAFGWNSMNIHAEYYIISLQLIIFALIILLSKYKNLIVPLIHTTVSIIFILSYVNLFQEPYYNVALFEPMHSTGANAFECGFNFVYNPDLFLEFNQKISSELQEDYMKGAKEGWQMAPQEIKRQIFKKAESMGPNYLSLYLNLEKFHDPRSKF